MNETLKKIQKETGIKQGQYDNEKNRLYNQGLTLLKMLNLYVKQVEDANMADEQYFLNFLDSINEISVRY